MRKTLAVATVFGLTSAASAGVIWDNGSALFDADGDGLWDSSSFASQNDTVYPFNAQVADDFEFDADGYVIQDIHWWGGYFNGDPITDWTFNFYIYEDDGTGQPTGAGMANPETTAVWALTGVPLASTNETDEGANELGTQVFSYWYDLDPDDYFTPTAGQRYWLTIQAEFAFPPQWGWNNTDQETLNTARYGFPLLGVDYWADREQHMAFQLTGVVPAPGALALLGLAGFAARRRRR